MRSSNYAEGPDACPSKSGVRKSFPPLLRFRLPRRFFLFLTLTFFFRFLSFPSCFFSKTGANDATVIFKSTPGSKRWQHASSRGFNSREFSAAGSSLPLASTSTSTSNPEPHSPSSSSSSEPSYTVILGSHRNSCLKFERDGVTVASARNGPGARLPASGAGFFLKVWVNVDCSRGLIAVGAGNPGSPPFTCWRDPQPWPKEQAKSVRHVGLSAWDAALAYRSISVRGVLDLDGGISGGAANLLPPQQQQQQPPPPPEPPLSPPAAALLPDLFAERAEGRGEKGETRSQSASSSSSAVPRLSELAAAASAAEPVLGRAAAALAEVCRLSPALDALRPTLAAALASGCPQAAETDRKAVRELPLSEMEALLADPRLACSEERVLGIVLCWARAEREAFSSPLLLSGEEGDEEQGEEDKVFAAVASACLGSRTREERDGGEGASTLSPPPARLADLDALLPLVRFPLMRPSTLSVLRASKLAASSQELLPLLDEADAAQRQHQQPSFSAKAAEDRRPEEGKQLRQQQQQQQRRRQGKEEGHSLSLALGVTGARGVTASPAARAAALLPPGAPRRAALAAARSAPRPPRGGVDLLFMAAGDGGGALQWLATAGGTRPRLNPAACGAVTVRCSSPACRGTTDPRALVSGCVAACNRAGPPPRSRSDGEDAADAAAAADEDDGGAASASPSSFAGGWWEIDLSPSNAALALDYYTLRADGSGDWPRNWALLGSDGISGGGSSGSSGGGSGGGGGGGSGRDGGDAFSSPFSSSPGNKQQQQQQHQRWTLLRRHVQDTTLSHAGCYGSWAVTGAAAARAWRSFRIVSTGPHAGPGAPPGALALSGVELYGSLFVGEAFEALRGGGGEF